MLNKFHRIAHLQRAQQVTKLMPLAQTRFSTHFREETDPNELLFKYQRQYERNPENLDSAHKYFQELNRLGKCQTVLRLF